MFPEERRSAIISSLAAEGRVQVTALAQQLEVSEVTVRQDLAYLEERGLLKRTHGGAIPVETGFELPFARTAGANAEEKARIAAAAAALVREGETILIDVGTTTTAVARALIGHRRLTVVTNALNIAALLEEAPGVTVIVTGGSLRAAQHSLVNPLGMEILNHVRADRAFLGASGVEARAGVTNANFPEAEIKRAMMAAAREKIVVVDSSKIGRVATAVIGPVTAFDRLITAKGAAEEDLDALRAKGLATQVV
ncbi:MAG: DeoR/GlpR family DNA-binding transcription regulator [Bacteroidota bacterium]